jgi:hypothetical protein
MRTIVSWVLAGLAVMPICAHAYEPVRFDEACRRTGTNPPLRQTIVVVDEGAFRARDGQPAKGGDKRWIHALVELADAREGATTNNMEAGERLVVMIARANGSELVPLFLGCSPNLSAAELSEREKSDSTVDRFFGRDTKSLLKRQLESFQSRILEALTQVNQQVELDDKASKPIATDGFIRALASSGRLVDLAYGVPRFVLMTDLRFVDPKKLTDRETARKIGFEWASKANLDLSRAEVHTLNLGDASVQHIRDFAEAMLLGSKGLLIGWRTDGLPPLQAAPIAVRHFGGTIDYAGLPAPIQIRLAFDKSGTLVNSWVEVTVSKAVATPMTGKAICQGSQVCEVKGDGKLLGQAWSTSASGEPKFGEELPFAGLRYFALSTTKDDAAGRIYDPKAKIRVGSDQSALSDDFRFTVKTTLGQVF